MDHLNAVLCRAQKTIGVSQVVPLFGGHELLGTEKLQRFEGVALTQLRFFPGVDQLQRLDEKLYFADPALSQLEIQFPFFLTRQAAIDLLLHDLDILDHGVVEVATVDEGLQAFQKLFAQGL